MSQSLSIVNDPEKFADYLIKSDMLPKSFRGSKDKPASIEKQKANIIICLEFGRELGLGVLSSLQNITCINGIPTVWGDTQLALVHKSRLLEDMSESVELINNELVAKCVYKRKNIATPYKTTFSQSDAVKARLWGNAGPWTSHPKLMLKYKARAFGLRTLFPDVLRGTYSTEEMIGESLPMDINEGETIDISERFSSIEPEQDGKKDDRSLKDKIIDNLNSAKNIDELKSVWVKYSTQIAKMPEDDAFELDEIKNYLKVSLTMNSEEDSSPIDIKNVLDKIKTN